MPEWSAGEVEGVGFDVGESDAEEGVVVHCHVHFHGSKIMVFEDFGLDGYSDLRGRLQFLR